MVGTDWIQRAARRQGAARHRRRHRPAKTDGTLDTTFGTSGLTRLPSPTSPDFYSNSHAWMAMTSDGGIVLAGWRLGTSTGIRQAVVRRYTATGAVDHNVRQFGEPL